jgi:hypothetical protein
VPSSVIVKLFIGSFTYLNTCGDGFPSSFVNTVYKLTRQKMFNLPNRVLKECSIEMTPAIRAIFQKFIDSGTLPEVWTNANEAPIFKKGDRHQPSNYRPVSLTSVISKL